MITLISPSKSVMKRPAPPTIKATEPLYKLKTDVLLGKLRKLSEKQLKRTLKVSAPLAKLNYERFQNWENTSTRPALWMYSGDVYNGIDAYSLDSQQINYAQNNLLVISGFYGLVRPLDGIRPYRLEMKLPLKIKRSKNLYDYWSKDIGDYLAQSGHDTVLICASKEYAKAVTTSLPADMQSITPRFMQNTSNGLKEKGLFAKYGRGLLARWVIDKEVTESKDLQKFNRDGFVYNKSLSCENEIVFIIPNDFSLLGRFTKQ